MPKQVLKGEEKVSKEEMQEARKVVKLALIRIGIRCDLVGFGYLCTAVEYVINDPEKMKNLCKGLYREVAKANRVEKVGNIERSIRHAIDNTYVSKSFTELNKMFKTMLYTIDDKPTAGELIRLVSEWYLLGLYKE